MNRAKAQVVPKNQHWVPQFYLTQFATADTRQSKLPKVWVWDKSKGSSLDAPVSVRNICGQRYLYSPEDESGLRDPAIEKWLSDLEGTASTLWPLLLAGEINLTNVELRKFLADFIAVMHLRNVFLYRKIDKAMELRDKLYGGPKEEFLNSRRENDPDPTHSGRYFVHTFLENIEKFSKYLSRKPWIVFESKSSEVFTSDRPVVFTLKSLFRAGSELLLPLSPRHVLGTHGFGGQPLKYVAVCPEGLVSATNQFIEDQASKFIISETRREAMGQ